jgi:hypothetical protein
MALRIQGRSIQCVELNGHVNGIDEVKQSRVSGLDLHGMLSGRKARHWDRANSRLNIGCIMHQGQPLHIRRERLAKPGGA